MKKIFIVLALLLVFSVLYSCAGGDDTAVTEGSETETSTEAQTTADTQNRISQSTLPPLDDGDGDDGDGGGVTPPTIQTGDSKYFKYETHAGEYGNSLTVTEDAGFGGEVNRAG